MATVLSSDIDLPQMNDKGDTITKPGRRTNGYSQQEWVEAFFGKDMTRRLQTENVVDPLYVEQKTLKERFPIKDFLKRPVLDDKQRKIDAMGY